MAEEDLKTPLLQQGSTAHPNDVVVDIPAHDHVLDNIPAERARADQATQAAKAQAEAQAQAQAQAQAAKAQAQAQAAKAEAEAEAKAQAQAQAQAKSEAERKAKEREAKARQEASVQRAATREQERTERMENLSKGLVKVYSEDFHKKITDDHKKRMKELVDERSKIDEKVVSLVDKCSVLTTPLFTYMTGTITLYGVVNVAMLASDPVGIWRTATLVPFIYLLNYHKDMALAQLNSLKENEMRMIKAKRVELIQKVNQLRYSVDVAAPEKKTGDEMKMSNEPVDIFEHFKLAQRINEEAAGDNFHNDCVKILAPIPEPDFEAIKRKISATFISGLLVLVILGICFVVHAVVYYLIPRSAPAPPPHPSWCRDL